MLGPTLANWSGGEQSHRVKEAGAEGSPNVQAPLASPLLTDLEAAHESRYECKSKHRPGCRKQLQAGSFAETRIKGLKGDSSAAAGCSGLYPLAGNEGRTLKGQPPEPERQTKTSNPHTQYKYKGNVPPCAQATPSHLWFKLDIHPRSYPGKLVGGEQGRRVKEAGAEGSPHVQAPLASPLLSDPEAAHESRYECKSRHRPGCRKHFSKALCRLHVLHENQGTSTSSTSDVSARTDTMVLQDRLHENFA